MATNATFSVLSSIVLFLFVADIFAAAPYVIRFEQHAENRIEKVMREYLSRPRESGTNTGKKSLTRFNWLNCGGTEEKVNFLSLEPDPVHLPGTLNITAIFDLLHELDAPLPAQLIISKKIDGVWINLPCIDNVGSCDYPDICALLATITDCPEQIKNCHCPFQKGRHTIKYPNADIGAAFLPSGDYNVTGILKSTDGKRLGCLSFAATVA